MKEVLNIIQTCILESKTDSVSVFALFALGTEDIGDIKEMNILRTFMIVSINIFTI